MKFLAQMPYDPSYRNLGAADLEINFHNANATKDNATVVAASGNSSEHSKVLQEKVIAFAKTGEILNGTFYFTVEEITEALPGKLFVARIIVYIKET